MTKFLKKSLPLLLLVPSLAFAQTANSGYPESQLNPAYAADTGATNVLVATIPSCPSAYVTGQLFKVKPNNNNSTTTPTVNICGLGAKTVVKIGGAALAAGDLTTSQIAVLIYDGTTMTLINPQTNNSGTVSSIATTGPIGGGTITSTGTITCTTCATAASSLTSTDLVIGSGSQGLQTDSGIVVTSHVFSTYGSLTTAGLGVPVILATSDVTAQTASQSTVNLIASTSAAGHYLVRVYANQNALCTTGTGQVYATVNWTDASHAHSSQTVTLNLITTAISTPYGFVNGVVDFWAASATAITYTTTYTACATGTASYDLHAEVERTI